MALSVKKGSFNSISGVVPFDQIVTGVGFQPKALILFTSGQFADVVPEGFDTIAQGIMGMATGSALAQQRTVRWACDDNVSITNALVAWRDGVFARGVLIARLKTFDVDGFTLTWSEEDPGARVIHYIAIGGADLSNVLVKEETMPVTSGNQAFTGYGFQPDALVLLCGSQTALGFTTQAKFSFGVAVSSTKRWGVCITARHSANMTANVDAMKQQRTDGCLFGLTTAAPVQDFIADLVSLNADGFTLNFIDPPPSAYLFAVLALKGPQVDAGAALIPAAIGNQSITGVAFQPKLALLETFGAPPQTAIVADAEVTVGAATGATERGCIWANEEDAVLPTQADRSTRAVKCLLTANSVAGGGQLDAEADFVSFNTNGFTIDWTDAPSTAGHEWVWFVLGDAPPAAADDLATKLAFLPGFDKPPGMLVISGG